MSDLHKVLTAEHDVWHWQILHFRRWPNLSSFQNRVILKSNIVCFDLMIIYVKGVSSNIGAAPEINILPVQDIVSGSLHFVPVTHNLCQFSVYDILLKFENLPVIDRQKTNPVSHT